MERGYMNATIQGKAPAKRRWVKVVIAALVIASLYALTYLAASTLARRGADAAVATVRERGTKEMHYVLDHADARYVGAADKAVPRDMATVASLLVEDGSLPEDQMTLDGVWKTDKDGDGISDNWQAVIGQTNNEILLYELDPDSDYYVGIASTAAGEGLRVTDWAAGYNDTSGTVYDDVLYDDETGLVYVPKKHTEKDDEDGIGLNSTRVQLMYAADPDATKDVSVRVDGFGINGKTADDIQKVSLIDGYTTVRLASDKDACASLSDDSIDQVFVNGGEVDDAVWDYDSETGELSIAMMPTEIKTVEAVASNSMAKSVKATLGAIPALAWENKDMPFDVGGTWEFTKKPTVGECFNIDGATVNYVGRDPNMGTEPVYTHDELYGNTVDALARAILNGDTGYLNHTPYYYAGTGDQILGMRTGGGTFGTSDGGSVKVHGFSADMYCAHIKVSANGSFAEDGSNDGRGPGERTWPVRIRIARVEGDQIVFGAVTPTANTQAGCGLYAVHYKSSGKIKVHKSSSDAAGVAGNGNYTLAGAVYGVYGDAACTHEVGTLTTNENGDTGEVELSGGNYWVKEKTASAGYALDATAYPVALAAGETKTVQSTDVPIKGKLTYVKSSGDTGISDDNDNYSLEGAEYGVFRDEACTDRISTLVANKDGVMNTIEVYAGAYWVKEVKPPRGYDIDKNAYRLDVTANDNIVVKQSGTDEPLSALFNLVVHKIDIDTRRTDHEFESIAIVDQGNATLKDTEFTVKYYDGYYNSAEALPSTPERTWVIKTVYDEATKSYIADINNPACFVSGSKFYVKKDGTRVIPLGTITVQETKAPVGYNISNDLYIRQYVADPSIIGEVKTIDVKG